MDTKTQPSNTRSLEECYQEAISWEGTPYRPCLSTKGKGVDCGRYVAAILGISDHPLLREVCKVGRKRGADLPEALTSLGLTRVDSNTEPESGMVVVLKDPISESWHTAWVGPNGLCHCILGLGVITDEIIEDSTPIVCKFTTI